MTADYRKFFKEGFRDGKCHRARVFNEEPTYPADVKRGHLGGADDEVEGYLQGYRKGRGMGKRTQRQATICLRRALKKELRFLVP